MATEVSCGQCHGRLLVETLGVVVACPHCGTHLSIPAPDPVPVLIPADSLAEPPSAAPELPPSILEPAPMPPEFTPVPVSADPNPALVPAPAFVPTTVDDVATTGIAHVAADVGPTAGLPATGAAPVAADDLNSSSVFGSLEEQSDNPAQGWHSAPNLYLNAKSPDAPSPETAAAPLMDQGSPDTEATVQFSEMPAETELHFSSTQQFSLGPPVESQAPDLAPPQQFTTPPQEPVVFATAAPVAAPSAAEPPVAPPPSPVMFAAAPAPLAPPSAPLTFGAAPAVIAASPAPPATPLTFGAAPAAAPAAYHTFTAAPPQAPPIQATVLPSQTVAQEAAGFAASESLSRQKFLLMLLIIVASYASAVTIVLVYMLIFGRTSNLESLPDLTPPTNKNGDISWQYNQPKNELAPGHVLSLGQSRRFGNVRVTPIKVTRGRVKFEHYSGKREMDRDPSEPVLKLWVKFENASRDQTFAPLDSHMLYTRKSINLGESVQANGFIAIEANRQAGKSLFHMFDTPVSSEFRMIGQNLNRDLEPGGSVETFIPSEEDARKLSGDLVWRFQFRKGYHPASKRGVTTLIDVRFNSKDITDEKGA